MSTSGMMPPITHQHVVEPLLLQQLHQPRRDVIVRAREDRQADDVGVLLQRGRRNLLGRLPQAGVDDLHAGVAQRARNDLGAAVVAVEARLGDDDSEFSHTSGIRDRLHEWHQSVSPQAISHQPLAISHQKASDDRHFFVLAPDLAESVAHLADRGVGAHRIENARHQVLRRARGARAGRRAPACTRVALPGLCEAPRACASCVSAADSSM